MAMSRLISRINNCKLFKTHSSRKHILSLQSYDLRPCYCTSASFLKAEKLNNSEATSRADSVTEKIVYNSKIKSLRPLDEKIEKYLLDQEIQKTYESRGPNVIALKYFTNNISKEEVCRKEIVSEDRKEEKVQFPYAKHDTVSVDSSNIDLTYDVFDEDTTETNNLSYKRLKDLPCKLPRKKWMKEYNKYSEVYIKQLKEVEESDEEDTVTGTFNYGTADPKLPASSVPCGGCGAHLHCQDTAIPGFLPKEIFSGLRSEQLQSLVCQRCHFLREYNTALSVSVDPELYPQMISRIKSQKALVILVVDMTDFPCSIWPDISKIIGPKRPLMVVGNKVDLLQDWSKDWLERARQSLISHLPPRLNLLHTTLISAKTGYGIEELITKLWKFWEYRGDVYLVGCTNVGKSTLFNLLLQSDYCKTKAVDLIQRATTAPWPGTTLNLLKFPILRPEGWRVASRTLRLRQKSSNPEVIQKGETTPHMITAMTRTFSQGNADRTNDEYWDDPFAMPKLSTLKRIKADGSGLDPNDPVFANSKWLYDTPGVITPDQIIDLLTTEELLTTLPQKPLVPRTYQLWPEHSIWLGGVGRLDYLDGPANIKVTVLAADSLPITICPVRDCAEVYDQLLGSEALAVPRGSPDRLRVWPGLSPGSAIILKGTGWPESCADVVLSSAGWIAVAAQKDSINRLQAWTPQARGIHVRIPPVLPRAIAVKGARLFRSPAYAIFNDYIKANR